MTAEDYDFAAHTAADRARRGLPATVEDPQALHAAASMFLAGRRADLLDDAKGKGVAERVGGASGSATSGPVHHAPEAASPRPASGAPSSASKQPTAGVRPVARRLSK